MLYMCHLLPDFVTLELCHYLNQPRFEFLVKKDIEAENFKAGTPPVVAWEAGAIVVL